jgi:hypothetical protein
MTMTAPESLRSAAVRAACELLSQAEGGAAPAKEVAYTAAGLEWEVKVEIRRKNQETTTGNGSPPQVPPKLTKLDRLILERSTERPVTMAALAGRCAGHDPDSYFGQRVRRLVKLGLLADGFEGYSLPERKSDGQ